jgi:hypothetical protein
MTTSAKHVKQFFDLLNSGAKAALDVCLDTGEVVCQASHNTSTGAVGKGTPGQTFTDAWTRVASCADGKLL